MTQNVIWAALVAASCLASFAMDSSSAATIQQTVDVATSHQEPIANESPANKYQDKIRLASALWSQHRVNEAWAALNQVPESERQLEWQLANHAFRGTSRTLLGHQQEVTCLAFSPDGSRLVSGGTDGRVILWDTKTREARGLLRNPALVPGESYEDLTGRPLWTTTVPGKRAFERAIIGVAFAPDSQRVLCATMIGHLFQLDSANGMVVHSLKPEEVPENAVQLINGTLAQYLDGGTKVAVSISGCFSIVDVATGRELAYMDSGISPQDIFDDVSEIAARSDAKLLAAVLGNEIRIWDVAKQQWGRTFSGSESEITKVAFSPDGKRLVAANSGNQMLLWDFSNRRAVHKIQAPAEWFENFAISPDNDCVATSSGDGTLRVWDALTGELKRTFVGHNHGVHQLEFSPNSNQLASAGIDGTVRIWNIEGSSLLEPMPVVSGEEILAISANGRQAVSRMEDDTLRIWDVETRTQELAMSETDSQVESVRFSPDGEWLATGGMDGQLSVWDARTGFLKWQVDANPEAIVQIEFSPSGTHLATRVEKGPVQLWNTVDGTLSTQMAGHGANIVDVAFSPDGESLATGDWYGRVQFWDLRTLKKRRELNTQPDSMRQLTYSPDGRLLATIGQNTLNVWENETGKMRFTTGRNSRWFNQLAFADGGSRIVTIDDANRLIVWSTQDGAELFTFETAFNRPQYSVGLVSINLLDSNSLLLNNFETGWYQLPLSAEPHFHSLLGHQEFVLSTAIDAAGQRVISGSEDQTARVWDVESGRLLHTFLGHHSGVKSVAISQDGKLGLSADRFGHAFIWDLATGQQISEVDWRPETGMTRVRSSPDRTTCYGRLGDNFVAWDPMSGKILKWLHYYMSFGEGLAISPDGTRLATVGQTYSVEVYNTSNWSRQTALALSTTFADALAFDSKAQRIATAGETTENQQTLKVWDANNGLELISFADVPAKIESLCFSPDGLHLATGDRNGEVVLRNLETGQLRRIANHRSWVACVKFSPDGSLLASSGADGLVLLTDPDTGEIREQLIGQRGVLTGLDFSRDGKKLVAVGPQNTLRIWDVDSGAELDCSEALSGTVRDVAFCEDDKHVVIVGAFLPDDSPVSPWALEPRPDFVEFPPLIWDVESGSITPCLQVPKLDTDDIRADFSADGSMISIRDTSGKSLTWETRSGMFLPDVQLPEPVRDQNLSADGRLLVLPQYTDVGVYRLPSQNPPIPSEK